MSHGPIRLARLEFGLARRQLDSHDNSLYSQFVEPLVISQTGLVRVLIDWVEQTNLDYGWLQLAQRLTAAPDKNRTPADKPPEIVDGMCLLAGIDPFSVGKQLHPLLSLFTRPLGCRVKDSAGACFWDLDQLEAVLVGLFTVRRLLTEVDNWHDRCRWAPAKGKIPDYVQWFPNIIADVLRQLLTPGNGPCSKDDNCQNPTHELWRRHLTDTWWSRPLKLELRHFCKHDSQQADLVIAMVSACLRENQLVTPERVGQIKHPCRKSENNSGSNILLAILDHLSYDNFNRQGEGQRLLSAAATINL